MAARLLSMEQVLDLLTSAEDHDIDDPQEVIMEGSDEEFDLDEDADGLDEVEEGTVCHNMYYQ